MLSLRLAIDAISIQTRKFLLSVLLIFIGLLLVTFAVMSYAGQSYAYSSCDRWLTRGIEGTAFIDLISDLTEIEFHTVNKSEFINEVYGCPEVDAIGDYTERGRKKIPELYEIQSNSNDYIDDGSMHTLNINVHAMNVFKLEIAEGMDPDTLDFSKNDAEQEFIYLYLGSAYKHIPVGTEFHWKKYTYIVAGILEDSQKCLDPQLINGFYETLSYEEDCTYKIIAVEDDYPLTNILWLSAADGYTVEQAIEAADRVAEKYGISFNYTTLEDRYGLQHADSLLLRSYLSKLLLVILPSVIVMLACMQAAIVFDGLKEYGILYSLGFSKKNVTHSIILRNGISCFIAFVLVIPVAMYIASQYFSNSIKDIIKTVLFRNAFPCVVAILVFILCFTSGIAVIILNRYSTVELIGGIKND